MLVTASCCCHSALVGSELAAVLPGPKGHYLSLARFLYFVAAPHNLALLKQQKAHSVAAVSFCDQSELYLFAGSNSDLRQRLLIFQSSQGKANPDQKGITLCLMTNSNITQEKPYTQWSVRQIFIYLVPKRVPGSCNKMK